jgi:hypothetical protein
LRRFAAQQCVSDRRVRTGRRNAAAKNVGRIESAASDLKLALDTE